MKAFVEHEVPRGLGKKSMVVLPIDNGGLIISVPYASDDVYFGHLLAGDEWSPNTPTPDDGLAEIELPDDLYLHLTTSYEDRLSLDNKTSKRLRDLVLAHRRSGLIPIAQMAAPGSSVQQILEQIRTLDT